VYYDNQQSRNMANRNPMQVVPFRVPDELVKRLDKYAARLRREQPGLRATRADALRMLLTEALDQKEARNGKA
jgi:predicted transcriptional regulator